MMKKILTGAEAKKKLLTGIQTVADAVKWTLGPAARTVILERPWGAPSVINDGVTIAKDVELECPFEMLGVKMLQEVAINAQNTAGDGTTTATLLAEEISRNGMAHVLDGCNPVTLTEGIEDANFHAADAITGLSIPTDSNEMIQQVATVAANNDPAIGKLIADAVQEVGKYGVITVQESGGVQTDLSITTGFELDEGYLSPYLINDNERMECELDDCLVFLTGAVITSNQDIVPLFEQALDQQKALFIVAKNIEGEALRTLLVNASQGVVRVGAIKVPSFHTDEAMQDLAVMTGATYLPAHEFQSDAEVDSCLGTADRVIINNKTTRIIGNKLFAERMRDHCASVAKLVENTDDPKLKEAFAMRLAKLQGGAAVLRIGAATPVEMREKKERVDDAIHATRAAMSGGVVLGGGYSLLYASNYIRQGFDDAWIAAGHQQEIPDDFVTGSMIVADALERPFRQIRDNAGVKPYGDTGVEIDGDMLCVYTSAAEGNGEGFNAKTNEIVDLSDAGIWDAADVVISSIRSAGSISKMILTTETLIAGGTEQ
jgi:chaperonin GroEL